MKKNPVLSVIIPMYGMEKYIAKCLDSIISQSYKDLEIICVNDASPDKSRDIAEDYAQNDARIRIVDNKENLGLFRARVAGLEASTGDYVAFVDADDYISNDWYRPLIKKISETNSDMVIGNTVTVDENGYKFYYNNYASFTRSHKAVDNNLLKTFLENEGSCYAWHTVWNKVYSRELIDKCMPYFRKVDFHLIMLEDIAFSSVFYTHARRLEFADVDCYFYYRHSGASTSNDLPKSKVIKNILDAGNSFRFVESCIKEYNNDLYEEYKELYERLKARYHRIWSNNLKLSGLENDKEARNALREAFNKEELIYPLQHDFYFYELTTRWSDRLLYIKKLIASDEVEVLSFDIFDTLITRPFLDPTDVYLMVGKYVNTLYPYIQEDSFKRMRMAAERQARSRIKRQDILLSDIYEDFSTLYNIPIEDARKIEEKEIECELKYCTARKTAKELYEYALHVGTRVIITSDMYLPKDVIEKILAKNGFEGHEHLYLSSEVGLLKSSGDLFKYVINDLGINPNKMLHIGDTWSTDIIQAQNKGIQTHFFPKAVEVYKNGIGDIYTGNGGVPFTRKLNQPQDTLNPTEQLPTKCALALMANKAFDNPYRIFQEGSSYNADSYYMGYSTLGMHILGMAEWMYRVSKEQGYKKVVFLARDGKLVKEVFDMLCQLRGADITSEYFYATRKSLMPYSIKSAEDILNINQFVGVYHMPPRKILSLFRKVLKPLTKEMEKEYEARGINLDEKMKSEAKIYSFLRAVIDISYDEELRKSVFDKASEAFRGIFDEHTATFDAGYSGRLQSIICDLAKCPVDTFYIHSNGYNTTSKVSGFKIHSYYDYTPSMSSIVRECFMSDPTPSCYEYEFEDGKIIPLIEEKTESFNCDAVYAINEIQKGAVDFCRDYLDAFGDMGESFVARNSDYNVAFDYFLLNASNFDRYTFVGVVVEDEVYSGYNSNNLYAQWSERIYPMQSNSDSSVVVSGGIISYESFLENCSKPKKFMFLLMFDRRLLKEKVKPKLQKHKIIYGMSKFFYSVCRGIYRLFKPKRK